MGPELDLRDAAVLGMGAVSIRFAHLVLTLLPIKPSSFRKPSLQPLQRTGLMWGWLLSSTPVASTWSTETTVIVPRVIT